METILHSITVPTVSTDNTSIDAFVLAHILAFERQFDITITLNMCASHSEKSAKTAWSNSSSNNNNINNVLKPTGHVMHHQFNIQQLYALPTLYLCVLCLSENKQRLVPLTA